MERFSEAAVVLDARPYRERDLLLSALGENSGLLRGVLRGARGRRHARGMAAAQVLSEVVLSGFQRPSAELATFTEIEVVRSSFPLGRDLARAATAAAAAELLLTFCQPGEPLPRHFRLARGLLSALLGEAPPRTVLAYALVWSLRLGGVFPEPGVCSACREPIAPPLHLSGATGHPLCDRCAPPGSATLGADALRFLEASRSAAPTQPLPPPPEGLLRWLERLARDEAHRRLRALEAWRTLAG